MLGKGTVVFITVVVPSMPSSVEFVRYLGMVRRIMLTSLGFRGKLMLFLEFIVVESEKLCEAEEIIVQRKGITTDLWVILGSRLDLDRIMKLGFLTFLLSDREQGGLSSAAAAAVSGRGRVVAILDYRNEFGINRNANFNYRNKLGINRNANFDYRNEFGINRNANLDYRNEFGINRNANFDYRNEFGKSQRELRLSQRELRLSQCEYVNRNAIVEVRVANLETDLRYRRSRCELSIVLRFSWSFWQI
ncbi:hypothetical protein F3Y22_tig00110280pilonHSYRG00032 [Hibiscus syriacus]|uniref:Uncharacterized protein n=1 Tax=Hibiscus syriacus TaxID=106335 RepID=A0A6A3B8X4_HIBSY|nr:hypothetical protein F3Y22_tig00110280pilonHSYRG00032 [Hibiscus syriacus]